MYVHDGHHVPTIDGETGFDPDKNLDTRLVHSDRGNWLWVFAVSPSTFYYPGIRLGEFLHKNCDNPPLCIYQTILANFYIQSASMDMVIYEYTTHIVEHDLMMTIFSNN